MRLFAVLSILMVALWAASGGERVVARVNDYNITQKELDRQIDTLIPRNYIHANVSPQKRKEMAPKALDALIQRRALVEYAKSRGYTVSDEELQERVDRYIKAYGSKERLQKRLEYAGMGYDEFRDWLRDDMLLEKLYEKEVKVELSEEDLRRYYDENRHKFVLPPRYKAKAIYIRNDPTDPKGKQKARERAELVKRKLAEGEAFEDLAAKYSDDLTRIKGGDLGFVHEGMLEPEVERELKKLNEGEIAGPVETVKGYFFIKLEKVYPQKQLSFEEVKERLGRDLKRSMEKRRQQKIVEEAKKRVKIETFL